MPCVAPPGREACLQAGCCYDDMDRVAPCYYGNTGRTVPRGPRAVVGGSWGSAGLTDPPGGAAATVQCLLDGHVVVVVPRGLGGQPYNLDSVRLASSQPGCEPLRLTDTFVMFRFGVTQCGTTVQVGLGDHAPPPHPGRSGDPHSPSTSTPGD